MNWDFVFQMINLSVVPGWMLLFFVPRHRLANLLVHSYFYPFVLGLAYLYMLVSSFGGEGGMDTLQNLKLSFQRDEILILGWLHYLVFDLFIGAWITRDAHRHGIVHAITLPSLILTLFAGPVGLLSYLVIRAFSLRKFRL